MALVKQTAKKSTWQIPNRARLLARYGPGGNVAKKPLSGKPARKSTTATGGGKKKRRFRPGTVAIREIRRYQKGTNLLIPKLAFARLVREVAYEYDHSLRFSATMLLAIQVAAEAFLIGIFARSQLAAIHARRHTVGARDMRFVVHLTEQLVGRWNQKI